MRWNMRMKAAEAGIWKSTQLRQMFADAGLEISAGKMSGWWAGTPTTIRLEDLDVICFVLNCTPTDLLICEPEAIAARKPKKSRAAGAQGAKKPTRRQAPGRTRSKPPA
jgi:putative transcriptional regulator